MGLSKTIWASPAELIRQQAPDHPVLVVAPTELQAKVQRFLSGFPGLVTFAVKANPDEMVIQNLVAVGITAFDVASPFEIDLVRRLAPRALLHYNNPVRGRHEIAHAVAAGVRSWSVDSRSELDKLIEMVPISSEWSGGRIGGARAEISVRFTLPVAGAAYSFGTKFGATKVRAAELLARVAAAGFTPSLTFHPGTQCTDPMAWDAYIRAAGEICSMAGVRAHRLNVGGGFPAHRHLATAPALGEIFALIDRVSREVFGADRPQLVCEPGRGLVADAFALIARVNALRDGEHVFLNDGTYGTLTEFPQISSVDRLEVFSPQGEPRCGPLRPRVIFGPTCDSIDRLPDDVVLPADLVEGDYIVFQGMGAYSMATNTRFNGFGQLEVLTVMALRSPDLRTPDLRSPDLRISDAP